MAISSKDRKELKARAHHLKPVIRIGQKGITENLVLETDLALNIHELIKVHIAMDEKEQRKESGHALASQCQAEEVDYIGKIMILYRPKKEEA
ncbi:ribosome assembly RNA-binding protein YhbY [Mariprofundus erugo]|uniref:Ribosome assembly RNA-binding protein YhbY n=1 Tax=Mariprofundus erugo TaxID=2528639 RepID=A0A5R9GTQ5_9PROT|nr:ribosome assembly RNA-binding protein YhbY [Mariprofundus erugo]TLS68968.1 ribosome assembly RNA-binding protein YhbY [Mariprofundus erugo]TLS75262.1 ribosome assembly RNA-binding protein YhbY [Mariprofundus erugo]